MAAETVRFYDFDTRKAVTIPASELAPGSVRARVQGIGGVVWVDGSQIKVKQLGDVKHPPMDDRTRAMLEPIRAAFAEHYPLTLEEWELGFRRDARPEVEIAIWLHAAKIYTSFTVGDQSAERRADVYRCLTACMNATPDTVWRVLKLAVLGRARAQQIIDRFFGQGGRSRKVKRSQRR